MPTYANHRRTLIPCDGYMGIVQPGHIPVWSAQEAR